MTGRVEVLFCGFGGQGVILMGHLLGLAAVAEGLWAAGAGSYGAQARGSACRAGVVLAPEPADFPHVTEPDLLVALAPEAYGRYRPWLRPDGAVVADRAVAPAAGDGRPHLGVPAVETARDRLGSPQVANVVLLGAVVGATALVTADAVARAVAESVPARLRDLNQRALEEGSRLGRGLADRLAGWRRARGLGDGP
ncbi:2-oxoacid:acceptor oxidoreductase family protein [Deferrisoma sp.]